MIVQRRHSLVIIGFLTNRDPNQAHLDSSRHTPCAVSRTRSVRTTIRRPNIDSVAYRPCCNCGGNARGGTWIDDVGVGACKPGPGPVGGGPPSLRCSLSALLL